MGKSFFQIKYEITRNYYIYLNIDNYTPEQSAGRCYDNFYEEIQNNGIESIVVISTIIGLQSTNKGNIDEDDLSNIKIILDLYKDIDIRECLNGCEYEYLQDDIGWLQNYYEEITKN
ncbi:hypothetical protein [Bacillus cereus group sp. BfR-BA-01380]|uniref:hypothetical protein n=1 Tax=Bacillus cereus group sp. BfR-BA-01380 TaxID=2920324 RepID=UPI001F573AC2|nr:hypothetical protein [Bacillus cereus group sp. BfR-BA-01380]